MPVKPSEAAMIVAVVEAIPFWVKVALYGAGVAGQVVQQLLADGDGQLVPGDLGCAGR